MESYDERRRREEERRQGRQEDSGRHWWQRGGRDEERSQRAEERSHRAESGWLDYDRDYGRSDERQGRREEGREQGREERTRFSPDWSREGAEPRYSDDPYYSRNREQDSGDYSRRDRFGGWQSDDRRQWEQRSRASVPRSQRELSEHGEPGDYDPDWPYARGRQRNVERSRGEQQARGREEEGSHYRGYYTQSGGPFSYPGGQGYVFSESLTLHGPFTGRGPKGYKRSDEKIIEEACQRLERDGDIDASDIEVSAEDGVIRLRGTVDDRQTKRRAEECVESIYGARDVMNELRVSQRSAQQWQGSQDTQTSQSGRGSSQASQSGQGTQASQGTSTPGMRQGEQSGEDTLSPRH